MNNWTITEKLDNRKKALELLAKCKAKSASKKLKKVVYNDKTVIEVDEKASEEEINLLKKRIYEASNSFLSDKTSEL
jgi:hypothetical protein